MTFKPKSSHPQKSETENSSIPSLTLTVDQLPSRGLSYPEGTVITYEPYTYGDISFFSEKNLSQKSIIERMLSGISVNTMDSLDLSYSDFNYLCIYRKLSTFETLRYKLIYQCSKCGTKNSFIGENVEYEDIEAPALPASIDIGNETLDFSVMTVRSYLDNSPETDLEYLSCHVINKDHAEALSIITNAKGADVMEDLKYIDNVLYHGIKDEVHECEKCGQANRIDLSSSEAAILIPFRESSSSPKGRVRFGS